MRVMFAFFALGLATPAVSATALVDNFDTENGGAGQTSYNSFANWEVIRSPFNTLVPPTLLASSSCAGGSGSCVDMTGGPYIRSKSPFLFGAGDVVTYSVQASTYGRAANGTFEIGVVFPVATSFTNFKSSGAFEEDFGPIAPFDATTTGVFSTGFGNAAFRTFRLSFTAAEAGEFRPVFYSFGYTSALLIDNVSVSVAAPAAAVPESSTWAMMIIGFGLVGAGLRQRARRTTILKIREHNTEFTPSPRT